ncbi:MAG: hypothetical protein HY765_05185 [Rhodomicrobium sp.]|nr:hypothetical protein [Rhodomicrobium sp.]
MRGNLQNTWLILAVLIAAGVAVSWWQSAESGLAWWHILGLALSVLFLVLIWLWPGTRQPKEPPP